MSIVKPGGKIGSDCLKEQFAKVEEVVKAFFETANGTNEATPCDDSKICIYTYRYLD